MKEFFANIYEWFGLMPLYSASMRDYLSGWDVTCTGFIGSPWYAYIGLLLIILTLFIYVLQYHIIDSPRWNQKSHWWIFAFLIVLLNFLIAFTLTFNALNTGEYCNQLNLSISDCIGFALSNGIWSFIFFLVLTTLPVLRRFSINCSHTTFWRP